MKNRRVLRSTNKHYSKMVQVKDIAAAIESFAPLALQESYDNAGLAVGRCDAQVRRVLLAVDVTMQVIEEAVDEGCDMIVTHHPLLFHPLRQVCGATYVERCVEEALRRGIALYSAHTNLDSAPNGMSWRVGRKLGLVNMQVLQPTSADAGFGVVGDLPQPMLTAEFLPHIGSTLGASALRYGKIVAPTVSRVAVCTGAGASLAAAARRAECDVYVTSDLKYNDFLDAADSMTVVDAGHFETELCAVEIFEELLGGCDVEIIRSRRMSAPISYVIF